MSTLDMRNGSLFKKTILFTIPVFVGGFIQNFFNAADMIVVGNFAGSKYLAAVGATGSLCSTLINFFIGLSVGCGVTASHYFGSDNDEDLSKVINMSFCSAIVIGIFLAVIGNIFAEPLLKLIKTPYDILPYSVKYLKIFFMGMPANMVFNFMYSVSRSVGDTKRPMIYIVLAGIINVLLNLVFVIGLKMNVAGVAVATIISQYASATAITYSFAKEHYPLKLDLGNFKVEYNIIKKIFVVGLPAGVQSTIIGITNTIIQSAVNVFGSQAVAGYSAGSNIGSFVYVALNSVYHTSITMTAQNYGNKNISRIKKGLFISLGVVSTMGIIICSLGVIFKVPLLKLYTSDIKSIEAGIVYYNIVIRTYLLCGIMEVMTGCLRGLSKSLEAMYITLTGMAGIRILWNFLVLPLNNTLSNVFVAYPITWIITIMIFSVRLYIVIGKLEKTR
ncbi:MAG: MATE family efflux transporter [Clostridia bacterium]|nr:MATE family efflux transporter [Clostridia bacterium]